MTEILYHKDLVVNKIGENKTVIVNQILSPNKI